MQSLDSLIKKVSESHASEWSQLPDFPLYMDQVISYMPRQVLSLEGDEKLTSAMVNNYIKEGLLPRAQGKRYTGEHIAYLTAICILKQVLSVKELAYILPDVSEDTDVEEFYSHLMEILDNEKQDSLELLNADGKDDLTILAVKLAVSAYCRQYLCKRIIDLISEDNPEKDKRKK